MAKELSNPSPMPGLSAEVHPIQAILRFLRAVRYRRAVMIAALVASCLLGGLYYLTTTPVYESKASLMVVPTEEGTDSARLSGQRTAQNLIPTFEKVLSSDEVLQAALALLEDGNQADLLVDLENVPRQQWADTISNNLTVTVVRNTTVLELAYRSKEARAAAAVIDSILSAYLEFMNQLHRSTAGEIRDILIKQKSQNLEDLRVKENQLTELKKRAGLLVIREGDQDVSVIGSHLMHLQRTWTDARDQRLKAESQLAALDQAIRNGWDLQEYALAMSDSLGPEVLKRLRGLGPTNDYMIAQMEQQLLDSRAKEQSQLQLYGPSHPKVMETQRRIQIAESYLSKEISNQELAPVLLSIARQQHQLAVEHERLAFADYQTVEQEVKQRADTMMEVDTLEREVNRLRQWDSALLDRMRNIEIGEENDMLRAKILDPPKVPLRPAWPSLSKVALLSIILGLAAGTAIVYVQDLLDDHFRSPEELRMQLGLPVLAMIRKLRSLKGNVGIDAVHVHVEPNAADTEAFRTLRTALAFAEGGVQGLVISSSEPGDGKTTVVVNLAAVCAQSGKRTLLIDADMRRPGLTTLLDLRGQAGLSTALRQQAPLAQVMTSAIRSAVLTNLDVLPSGPRPPNPTELLASDRFSELLGWAETNYDQILIDSPPALVSDTAIIGRLVDGVLLVMRPDKNGRRVVIRAAESFPALGIKVLGIVLNYLSREKGKEYYGYGYGYEYDYGYGYGYGQDEDSSEESGATERLARPSKKTPRQVA